MSGPSETCGSVICAAGMMSVSTPNTSFASSQRWRFISAYRCSSACRWAFVPCLCVRWQSKRLVPNPVPSTAKVFSKPMHASDDPASSRW